MACPVCGKPADAKHRPFCSPRCKDVDLARWLGDGYRIPGPPVAGPATDPDNQG
jgi:uncharacterized protein